MNSSFFLGSIAAAVGFFTLFFTLFIKFRFLQKNKDIKSSALSLASPTTFVPRIWKHHVFPSFHGADVRKTFLSHILESFKRKGIDTCIDNEIERSKSIGPELVEAIRGSKIAIVLLSKNYASSSWCLDELVQIMICKEVLDQKIMPIFYEVDPTDINKQTGEFGKAFRKTCKGKTKEHIERWRKALKDVAQIAGEHSCNWHNEADMIENIATKISNMLNISTPSRDFDDFVGMEAHMEHMERLLCLDSDEVRMIGIWGPPGIGKTTIARFLFNQTCVSEKFEFRAIMVNIRGCYPNPCLDEYSVQLQLQNQMLSQIFNQKDIVVSHLTVAPERLKDKKVLLLLDDVDRSGQLKALAKEIHWFGPGSRIIITTEDRRVLEDHGVKHIYRVKFPSSNEAFQIFCMHAFKQKHPYEGFHVLSWEVMALAGNLPLGLKVLGSALWGMSKQDWETTLPILKNCLNRDIKSIIKFSYDALSDEEKDLFILIACLFINESIHKVEDILAKKFWGVQQGLRILTEKSLISVGFYQRIEMHALLQQFGRETSRNQFIYGLAKSHLLVYERDICEVLSDDTIDGRRFVGINFDIFDGEEELDISEKSLERMSDLQFVKISGKNLNHPDRLQSLLCHSQKIRSLDWMYFQNICLPPTFNPEFLVKLVMSQSKLHKLWEGTKPLRNLKWMDLSYSTDLKELPDLSTATDLKELKLEGCSSLMELPSCIGSLTNLQILNLSDCSSLVELPSSIENATSLTDLDLMNCSNLVEIPSLGNATILERLNLSNCSSLVKLPPFIVTNLQRLELRGCSSLVKLPSFIGDFTNLREIELGDCSSLVEFPVSTGTATNLQKLNLSGCSSLMKLPPSIRTAINLQDLDISGCSSLVELPSSIGDLINLKLFNLSNCSSLMELHSYIKNLRKLCTLRMRGCLKLEALPTNINLESLGILDLAYCSQLNSFPEISTNIRYLNLKGTAIKEVPMSIMSWSRLSDFRMSYFESLIDFPHALDIITELHLNKDIQEVAPWVKRISRLHRLFLSDCINLVSIPQFSDSLSFIYAGNCKSLERLDCSFNNPRIYLNFANCFKLNKVARDLIMHPSTCGRAILPGSQVPACFEYRATGGSSLTIKLNERHLSTSLRFKACVMLVMDEEETDNDDDDWIKVDIEIKDKQNDLKVTRALGYIPPLTEHIYKFEVKAMEVTSTELLFEFKTDSKKWKIGECGLLQIVEVPSS